MTVTLEDGTVLNFDKYQYLYLMDGTKILAKDLKVEHDLDILKCTVSI